MNGTKKNFRRAWIVPNSVSTIIVAADCCNLIYTVTFQSSVVLPLTRVKEKKGKLLKIKLTRH